MTVLNELCGCVLCISCCCMKDRMPRVSGPTSRKSGSKPSSGLPNHFCRPRERKIGVPVYVGGKLVAPSLGRRAFIKKPAALGKSCFSPFARVSPEAICLAGFSTVVVRPISSSRQGSEPYLSLCLAICCHLHSKCKLAQVSCKLSAT